MSSYFTSSIKQRDSMMKPDINCWSKMSNRSSHLNKAWWSEIKVAISQRERIFRLRKVRLAWVSRWMPAGRSAVVPWIWHSKIQNTQWRRTHELNLISRWLGTSLLQRVCWVRIDRTWALLCKRIAKARCCLMKSRLDRTHQCRERSISQRRCLPGGTIHRLWVQKIRRSRGSIMDVILSLRWLAMPHPEEVRIPPFKTYQASKDKN